MLARILGGEDEGTLFVAKPHRLQGRKRWIAFFHHPKGTLFVDDKPSTPCARRGKACHHRAWRGVKVEFAAGDVVRICDLDGMEFARGIARFGSSAVRDKNLPKEELIHRDDLVIL